MQEMLQQQKNEECKIRRYFMIMNTNKDFSFPYLLADLSYNDILDRSYKDMQDIINKIEEKFIIEEIIKSDQLELRRIL